MSSHVMLCHVTCRYCCPSPCLDGCGTRSMAKEIISSPRQDFMGPAGCNHCSCDRDLLSESSSVQQMSVQVLKRFVVTVAVVAACWSYEDLSYATDSVNDASSDGTMVFPTSWIASGMPGCTMVPQTALRETWAVVEFQLPERRETARKPMKPSNKVPAPRRHAMFDMRSLRPSFERKPRRHAFTGMLTLTACGKAVS